MEEINWTDCPDVERVPSRVSGQWVVKNTRILAQGVIDNIDAGVTPEELERDVFPGVGLERTRRMIAYARQHAPHPA
jgi:uncharacterized protein (DUF433 family)